MTMYYYCYTNMHTSTVRILISLSIVLYINIHTGCYTSNYSVINNKGGKKIGSNKK